MKSVFNKFFAVGAAILSLVFVGGCDPMSESSEAPNPSNLFEKEGLTIALSEDFTETEREGYTAYYESDGMIVATVKETYTEGRNSLLSVFEYVDQKETEWYLSQDVNSWTNGVVEEGGFTYFTYEDDEFGEGFKNRCFGYKAADAFWSVYFGCAADEFECRQEEILGYAKTVTVAEEFVETLAFEKIEGKEEYRVVGLGTVCGLEIVIPSSYDGLPVTEIEENVWANKRGQIRSVVIPDTVTEIGYNTFSNCYALESVTIGNGVKTIDDYAFSNCWGLTEIVIPDGVTSIGMEAFSYCKALESAEIGDSVKEIGMSAFFRCENLRELILSEALEELGSSAFAGCAMQTVSLPRSLTTISNYAFQGCTKLTEIVIPDTVVKISGGAFDQCTALERVTIPDSVTWLEADSFSKCPALKCNEYEGMLYLGNGNNPYLYLLKPQDAWIAHGKTHSQTKFIGASAFKNCYNLMSFEVGESVVQIGYRAFENCQKLFEIYNRSSLNIVADNDSEHGGIGACAGSVYTEEGQGRLIVDEKGYVSFYEGGARVLLGYGGTETDLIIPAEITELYFRVFFNGGDNVQSVTFTGSVEKIGEYAFLNCSLTRGVELGNGVTEIGEGAFKGCGMTELVIPDSVKTVEKYAFKNCEQLQTLTVGNSVETIGEEAFSGCIALEKAIVPDSVISLGAYAFGGCTGLKEAVVGDCVQTDQLNWFRGCASLEKLVLGDSITEIPANAFAWMSGLKTVVLGNSVESIGARAFESCENLTEIVIPASVTKIPDRMTFYGCASLQAVYYCGEEASGIFEEVFGSETETKNAVVYYYSETEPLPNGEGTAYAGNYWRYVDGVPTVWSYDVQANET